MLICINGVAAKSFCCRRKSFDHLIGNGESSTTNKANKFPPLHCRPQTSHELRLWQSIQGEIAVTKITTRILFLKAATFVGKGTTRVIRSAFDDPFAQTFAPHLTG
jgi:hypothetical protein